MTVKMKTRATATLVTVLIAAVMIATPASALVNLEWRPAGSATVQPGQEFDLDLFGVASGEAESIAGVEIVLSWDPTFIDLVGAGPDEDIWMLTQFPTYGDYELINSDLHDGNALFWTLGWLGEEIVVTPSGLKFGSFTFEGLAETAGTSINTFPALTVSTVEFSSIIASLNETGRNVLGECDSETITIMAVPEPASMVSLLGAMLGVLVTRRRK